MEKLGVDVKDIVAIGITNQCEITALDAAYLAGLAVGYWKSLEDIRDNWAIDKIFRPEMDEQTKNLLLKGWHKAVSMCNFCGRKLNI